MGSHEPADPKVPGQKRLKIKQNHTKKKCITKKKPKTILTEKKKVHKTVKKPKKTKNKKKHKVTVYLLFPDEMRSNIPICWCFRLIYILSDRKIECSGGG